MVLSWVTFETTTSCNNYLLDIKWYKLVCALKHKKIVLWCNRTPNAPERPRQTNLKTRKNWRLWNCQVKVRRWNCLETLCYDLLQASRALNLSNVGKFKTVQQNKGGKMGSIIPRVVETVVRFRRHFNFQLSPSQRDKSANFFTKLHISGGKK